MAGIQLRIMPRLPAQISGVLPIVVTKSGQAYTISFDQVASTVYVTQIKTELVARGLFDIAAAAIPGDPKDPANMGWASGGITQTTGPLLTAIFTAVGYGTPEQKDDFIAAAQAQPY